MEDGIASRTARSVAARRLTVERVAADYGDPGSDLALSADVANGRTPPPGRMQEYIRARTTFFDWVVVKSLSAGVGQVVIGAAGYDGRALRYAKPGVRWFEIDHPATQADKRQRITRLGISTRHITFLEADFRTDPVGEDLRQAGLDPRRPAVFLFEGIAAYLDAVVTEAVLAQFRQVTAAGSLLAISVSPTSGARGPGARAEFRARVAELGEPARSVLELPEATALLARAGWHVDSAAGSERRARLQAAGLLTARAIQAPSPERPRSPLHPPPPPVPVNARNSEHHDDPAATAKEAGDTGPDGTAVGDATAGGIADGDAVVGGAAAGGAGMPLHALLSRALVAFTIEFDNEAEHRLPHRTQTYGRSPGGPADAPWLISLAMWASSLRRIPDDGITVEELRRAARTGTNLAGLRRWGYITVDPEPTRSKQPARDALIRLTPGGREARDARVPLSDVVEGRWRDRFGAPAVAELREALAAIAAQLPAGLPDCLPILGYGLFSRVQEGTVPESTVAVGEVPDGTVAAGEAPEGTVAAGEVPDGTVAALPLWALLSRVLLVLAAEFEATSPVSLAICANVLRVLTGAGVRSRDIPDLSGVSKESIAMAMGVLGKRGLAVEGRDPAGSRWRIARLTPRGARMLGEYHELTADIEDAWRDRFGADKVDAMRAALERLPDELLLEGTDPYPDGWRAQVSPPGTLPYYPMVLHRGAYPDGS